MPELSRRSPFALLLASIAIGAAGCGSGSDAPDESATARQALLRLADLPPGSRAARKPIAGDECSPASYFRDYATGVATPPGFHMKAGDLLLNVGVFDDERDAHRAFAAITSPRSRSCIGRELQRAAVERAGASGDLESGEVDRRLPGREIHVMRVDLSLAFANVHVQRTAILEGRGVSTLTFISRDGPVERTYWNTLVPKAADTLASALAPS